MTKPAVVTQRAYTLRLKGVDPQDPSWRDALWETHETINKGAKAFGDWLLTLRGGLDHALADTKIPVSKGKDKSDRDPTKDERKARRILLALSWLSVESKRGAPARHIVAHDLDEQSDTRSNWKTVEALKEILKHRGLGESEIQLWVEDCSASLTAAIRDDAVWVNRSKAFDEAVESLDSSLTRDEVWDMLERFFGSRDAYLAPGEDSEESSETEQEDKAKDLVQKAGQWLSSRFGTGKGADFCRIAKVYSRIAAWAGKAEVGMTGAAAIANLAAALDKFSPPSKDLKGVLNLISGPGYKSATRNLLNKIVDEINITEKDLEKLKKAATEDKRKCKANTQSKGQRSYANAILKDVEDVCGFAYRNDKDGRPVSVVDYPKYGDNYSWGPARHSEYAVMLDHAARRVSSTHTWLKRAEAERRRFEKDAKRMNSVPCSVKAWLDTFCMERSEAMGALEPYRIRRRAVDGWDKVVRAWAGCQTEAERREAVHTVQSECQANDEKFGDAQLFEALADDDSCGVWLLSDGDSENSPDPQPLIDYVLATDAEFRKRHFKVPAYRHPDALLHPIFCDFGLSRWDIKFAVHEARKNTTRKTQDAMSDDDPHALSMTLWTGRAIESRRFRWQSKRLTHDLALDETRQREDGASEISRADRLGRAAAGVSPHGAVRIAHIFSDKMIWNGRLQAPRGQLNAIAARVADHGWDAKAKQMRDHLQWLITFSARLEPVGPWIEYKTGFPDDAPAKPFVSRRGDYAVKHQSNDERKGHAKLILSRLPGLRVLSVDLGHRYAAACAVWEALSAEQATEACQAAGHEPPKDSDLYLHLKSKETDGKVRTIIYRRIGADTLPDGKPHPAPWARLDRQFLIKLQGEDRQARKASPAEIAAVEELEKAVGRKPPDRRSMQVDDLMAEAVRTMRLSLRHHGRRARIAFNLTAGKKLLPGGREEVLTDGTRADLLADTLADWYDLFTGQGWGDEWAQQQWEAHVTPLLQGTALPQAPEDDEATFKARKKYRANLIKNLQPAAESLARDASLCRQLHCLWATHWRENDAALRKRLRWLRDWILPRGKAKDDRAIRHVGGLSLMRIATVRLLSQVQKAFHTRSEPEDLRKNIPPKGDDALSDFDRSLLDTLEHMREQRVKQLASRIAEAALGIGREHVFPTKKEREKKCWCGKVHDKKDPKRPRVRVDPFCHAVVIENLTHYRPEETRTRRENRQLMTWSSSKVKKYLAEACQLNGLHLREVQAAYTSRQDSRTGAPGVRCQDVPVREFMQSPFWRQRVAQAEKKRREGRGGALEQFLCDLDASWKHRCETDGEKAGTVRIPLQRGEIFVSADSGSPAAKGLQADLNAAANIGLKALADPDWPGKWWYVPCDAKTSVPVEDKVGGSAAICPGKPLRNVPPTPQNIRKARKKRGQTGAPSRDIINLWKDVSSQPISADGRWRDFTDYWNGVQARVANILRPSTKNAEDTGKR